MLFTNPFASLYESHHLQLDWPVSSKEPVPVPIVDDATTAHVLTIAQRPKPQRIARHANTLTSVRLGLGHRPIPVACVGKFLYPPGPSCKHVDNSPFVDYCHWFSTSSYAYPRAIPKLEIAWVWAGSLKFRQVQWGQKKSLGPCSTHMGFESLVSVSNWKI